MFHNAALSFNVNGSNLFDLLKILPLVGFIRVGKITAAGNKPIVGSLYKAALLPIGP